MPLEVIGAGLSRTGTFSLHHALEKLGYPTHHYFTIISEPRQDLSVWARAYDEPGTHKYEWEKVYEKYRAAVDFPTSSFYKELSERYPESKIILTVRSAESWFKSIHKTMIPLLLEDTAGLPQIIAERRNIGRHIWFEGLLEKDPQKVHDEEFMSNYFNGHIEKVKQTIPADRLLVYELGSGWDPLCKFLGKDVPDEPYPRTNDPEFFGKLYADATKYLYSG